MKTISALTNALDLRKRADAFYDELSDCDKALLDKNPAGLTNVILAKAVRLQSEADSIEGYNTHARVLRAAADRIEVMPGRTEAA